MRFDRIARIVAGLLLLSLLVAVGCTDGTLGYANGSNVGGNTTLALGAGVTIKLVLVPAGKFTMGSPETEKGRFKSEGPQREVTISRAFHMGIYEVTQAQWKAVMNTMPWEGEAVKPGDSKPAVCISWNDATSFCKALSKKTGKTVRLPTEAEWEYACRAGTTTAFCSGDDPSKLGDYAWYLGNLVSLGSPNPVGGRKPNAWGLYDMHGNVAEWCSDWCEYSWYAKADTRDPKGPPTGTHRAIRGGASYTPSQLCRSANRGVGISNERISNRGFRIVVGK